MPNLPVDVDSWGRSACYPRGSFYPLRDDSSTRCPLITMPDFRLCPTCLSRSQAPFCHCTLRMVSIHSEGTFGRLRYSLGGDRPSQTAHLTLSPGLHIRGLDTQCAKGGIPTSAPPIPKYQIHRVPPILCITHQVSILNYSKAPWGLSV